METIIDNFNFLTIETENQVKLTYGLLANFDVESFDKIISKDDYIDNLKTTVENLCFSTIHKMSKNIDPQQVNEIRAIHIICVNLERIADFCVNICRQIQYLDNITFIQKYDYRTMFFEIQKGLSNIANVFEDRDLIGALDICRVEFNLDELYSASFKKLMTDLNAGDNNAANIVTTIFIFRYLERIGDSILNIGEALIFAIIGDRIKIRQFKALEETLSESGFEGKISEIDFKSIWGSRSGCRISKVKSKHSSSLKTQGIFKEGSIKKIKKEKENLVQWNEIFPNIAPRIFGYYEKHDTASMLVEFLSGCTIDQIFLTEEDEVIKNVIYIFENTLNEIWETTKCQKEYTPDYMHQLKTRLPSIHNVHPDFQRTRRKINSLYLHSTQELINTCEQIEKNLTVPFTVMIHGDFNTNNIVYNHHEQRVNYIDLYRSKNADYVQDVSVFLVSNFRLPVFDSRLRDRLNWLTLYFFEFFKEFAIKNNDKTFEIRMAFALVRSFYTSTRFELNYKFARYMFLNAHFLMERIVDHIGKPWENFKLPKQILIY